MSKIDLKAVKQWVSSHRKRSSFVAAIVAVALITPTALYVKTALTPVQEQAPPAVVKTPKGEVGPKQQDEEKAEQKTDQNGTDNDTGSTVVNPHDCWPQPVLKQGASGTCVKHLQWYLNQDYGNDVVVDGQFGPITAKYLKQYQQDNNLAVDGIAGPQTWKSFTPAPTAVLSATSNTSSGPGGSIVEIASREIGVKEEVSGCNCGERIEVYTTGRNEAWCADFISWVYREHGTPFSGGWAHDWQLPAAISLKHWLQKNGTWHERTDLSDTPQPGDVINFNWFGDSNRSTGNHVGIVERVEGSTLYTIEGNRHNAVVQKEYPNYRQDTDIIGWGRM